MSNTPYPFGLVGSDGEYQSITKIEEKIPFMKLPVMSHSKYCYLSDHHQQSLPELGECEYDQGGYFIVNGGEKVLVSQERVEKIMFSFGHQSKIRPINTLTKPKSRRLSINVFTQSKSIRFS